MTAREFLQQTFLTYRNLDSSTAQMLIVQDTAQKITPVITGVPSVTENCRSKIEKAVVEMLAHSNELGENVLSFLSVWIKAATLISGITNDDERLILEYRYLAFFNWTDIARKFNCSVKRVQQLHGRALLTFEKIFSEK